MSVSGEWHGEESSSMGHVDLLGWIQKQLSAKLEI